MIEACGLDPTLEPARLARLKLEARNVPDETDEEHR
jgi:hypothetical protein